MLICWQHFELRHEVEKEVKYRRRTREKRFKIWTLKGEKVTEYRNKVEEEYQLEADTNAEES